MTGEDDAEQIEDLALLEFGQRARPA